MWCWRRMEKISWTDRLRNEGMLGRVKEDRNILQTIKTRKANWISHILRINFQINHVIERKLEEKIKVMEREGRRRKQILLNL
jgi:hypothetical protein